MSPNKRTVKEPDRTLVPGRSDFDRCDNKVVSARFTVLNFIPKVGPDYAFAFLFAMGTEGGMGY
jgi:hypothetical protein